jgi:flagellar L-ring protein precursor FlgH
MRTDLRNATRALVLAATTVLATSPAAAQNALIDLRTGRSLVSDAKALGVGDIVTILIVESTSANATTKMDASSKTEVSGGPGLGILAPFSAWGLDAENKHTGDGKTTRTGDLQAEISVRIQELLPNGYFRLVGTRLVEINGDRQVIEISGICRPQDIRADNTILSTYIADAQIAYSGTGALNDAAQPGVITRIVNWLF